MYVYVKKYRGKHRLAPEGGDHNVPDKLGPVWLNIRAMGYSTAMGWVGLEAGGGVGAVAVKVQLGPPATAVAN